MTKFVFKSLMIAGAFLFFGGHLPLPGDAELAVPQFACEADLGSCRLGETEVALGDRSPLMAALAARAHGNPAEDFRRSLADPRLASLLDEQVIPDFAVEAAHTRLAAVATQLIAGIETGAR
ncbi:hypothetical protein Plav_2630 [Parvibaculum lavamentivorans DS-1]|uniref:Uncharacterized protein n=1 Tax=Parvibaculum lavamentivorans (strain DS-1 / DSM 13023 / NCIMB 13966) TaxID=402881 RepID=A7HWF5_PARL1|nr:hypothetical protein [Parvibaculum lavamentivorans]ABS64238.1 hypothetical protein Plav_2630 [Parvibaculum lavamentivorans DS-1]